MRTKSNATICRVAASHKTLDHDDAAQCLFYRPNALMTNQYAATPPIAAAPAGMKTRR